MKKIIMFAAAALALFSCTNKSMTDSVPDAVSVTPESQIFKGEAGKVDIIVSSTENWTMTPAEAYDWVSASKTEGADGEVVTFTVNENRDTDKEASFIFTSGSAKTTFKVFSYFGEVPAVKVTSEAKITCDYKGQNRLEILATSPLSYRDLNTTLNEGADAWLKYRATIAGETENDAKIYFDVMENKALEVRDAVITISADGLQPAVVNLHQKALLRLETTEQFYTVPLAGGEIEVPVTSNVKYSIDIKDKSGWCTHKGKSAKGETFTVAKCNGGSRATEIVFTQTDAEAGVEPLTFTVKVTQVSALIEWAVDMSTSRLFPKWDGTSKPGTQSKFTLETMFKVDNFDKANGSVFTVMGIEGRFLLRFGDVGNPLNRLQVATSSGNYNVPVDVETNRWYHLAVTFDGGKVCVYYDGQLVGEKTFYYLPGINLSPNWSYEEGYWDPRAFWMGYSYDSNRDFKGLMTEMRIWKRALTKEEINAPNHFYTLDINDPSSAGLAAYWKFTEGTGSTIADQTIHGNKLYGETNVASNYGVNKGQAGIKWVKVSLPDR